jgi:hypothetical protein
MRKMLSILLVAVLLSSTSAQAATAARGGFMGFIGGCCFGLRAGAAYNDGKEIHWREWCRLIPYAGLVFAIWDGVDCADGKTADYFADKYGQMYY